MTATRSKGPSYVGLLKGLLFCVSNWRNNGNAIAEAVSVAVALAGTVVLAKYTFALVERPARDWFSAYARRFEQGGPSVAGARAAQLMA